MKDVTTYLTFDGNCREAMTFYGTCLGADLRAMPFSDMPGNVPPQAKDRIMHSRLTRNGTTLLMASDTMPGMPFQQGNNFSVSVECENLQEIERLFAAIGEKGAIKMPLQDVFWGARFGMLTDRFGINWMFTFEKPE